MFVLKLLETQYVWKQCLFECFRFCFVVFLLCSNIILNVYLFEMFAFKMFENIAFLKPFCEHFSVQFTFSVCVCVGTAGLSAGQAGGALA